MTEQATRARIPLDEARALADEVVDLLEVVTERIAIGGSIRRQRADVGDLEIVAIPRYEEGVEQVDMFTQAATRLNLLDARCRDFLDRGTFQPRFDKNGRAAFGEKYKRLAYKGFPLDLFSCTEANWGVILLLRTGPAEWNQRLVLKASHGGWLTRGYFFRDGQLWKLPPPYDASLVDDATPVPTREEADVFRALGYRYVPAEQRGEERPPVATTEVDAGGPGRARRVAPGGGD